MASSFGQYTSGIQPIQGISEAGARIGATYERGMSALGEGLAKGIDTYYKATAESAMIDQKAQALGNQLMQFESIFGQNPEYDKFGQLLKQQAETIAKIPEMSLAKKRGALNGAEVAFSQIGTQLQMFTAMKDMNEQRAYAESQRQENNPTKEIVDKIIPMALSNFDYKNKSYTANELEFTKGLDALKAQGVQIDVPAKLEEYRTRVSEAAGTLPDKASGMAILDQVNAARKIDTATSPDVEGYSEAEQRLATPAYSPQKTSGATSTTPELQYKLAEQSAELKNKANAVKPVLMDKLNSTIEQIKKEIAAGMTPIQFEKNLGRFEKGIIGDLDKTAPTTIGSAFSGDREKLLQNWYQTTSEGQAVAEILPLWKDAVQQVRAGIDSSGSGNITGRFTGQTRLKGGEGWKSIKELAEMTPALPSEHIGGYQELVSKISNPDARISAISGLDKIQSTLNSKKEALPTTEKVTPESVLSNQGLDATALAQLKLKPIDVTVPTEVPIAPEVRNQKAIDFMTQRLGYRDSSGNLVTPASVSKLFSQNNQPKSVYTAEGDRIITYTNSEGKTVEHFVPAKEQKSTTESIFGVQDPKTGELGYEKPIRSLDVAIRGKFVGGDDKAMKFKELLAKSAMVVDAMEQVKRIAKEHPVKTKLPWTDATVDVVSYQSKAIALMKEILALDRLSDKDVQIIMERIPQNDSWRRTASQTAIQADNVVNDIYAMLNNLGDAYKLDIVTPSKAGGSLKGGARKSFIAGQSSQK